MMRDPKITSRIMSAVRNRDTRPELVLRSALWRRGLRYRLRVKLLGKPDIVFPSRKVAVFVDGDYWHGNAWRVRRLSSFEAQFDGMNNAEFWRSKITTNMERDSKVNEALSSSGWTVIRVFESQLVNDIEGVVGQIDAIVRGDRTISTSDPSEIVMVRRQDGEVS